MAASSSIPHLVPGFDFLQDLVKGAGAAVPGLGQWVAPTLDPDELGKRIEELRTVQFWLEQNARVLATTVQALEVQRMTLSTLKSMNVSMTDMAEALKVQPQPATGTGFGAGVPDPAPAGSSSSGRAAGAAGDGEDGRAAAGSARSSSSRSSTRASSRSAKAAPSGSAASAGPGAVDPMQWWGALTRQFTDLAAQALRDGASAAAPSGPAAGQAAAPASAASPGSPASAAAAGDGKTAGAKTRSSPRAAGRSSGRRGSSATR